MRSSGSEVKKIFETDLSSTEIEEFITPANLIVTELLQGELNSDLLTEIERWLSAHFAAMWDQRKSKIKISDRSVTYEGKTGLGLESTRYGQQVLLLDTTGKLAQRKQKRAVIRMMGG